MGIASSMRELAQDIASSREDRTKTVAKVKEEASQTREEARDLIKGFQASRGKAGAQLRKDLARGKAGRKSDVKKMLGDAQGLIKGFQASRRKEGVQLRRELAQSRSSRESEVGELIKNAQDLVSDLGKSRQETGKKLREDLAKGKADREAAVKEMQSEFHKSQAAVRGDINEARATWQELTRGKPAKKVEEESPDLETKLLAAINEHPQGITLAEVAESLGVVPIVLGRAARKLVDEGKVRKEDRFYYPVARE